jgi:hypothetical protein
MNLKPHFAATALFLAASAQAAPVVLDISSGFANFSSAEATQEYQFSLASDAIGDGSVTATFGANSGYVISGISFNGNTLTPDVNTNRFTNYTLFDGPLSAGLYSFTVSGISKGGEYTGRIDVSAVPEATSMAYLLVGLAAVGMVRSRRMKK